MCNESETEWMKIWSKFVQLFYIDYVWSVPNFIVTIATRKQIFILCNHVEKLSIPLQLP